MSRRRALVTGPTAGIGLAFAHRLASSDHDLVLVARDRDRLHQVATELRSTYGVEVEVLVADLADREQLRSVESRLASATSPIDLLVNNAGFGLKEQFLDTDVEAEQAMLDVLVVAVMRLTHAALGAMAERGDGGVVNVSSVSGFLMRGSYGAAKTYVIALSRWADAAYRDRGVRVMALCPGFTRTEFHGRMDVSRGSAPSWLWLDPDRLVADALKDFEKGVSVSVPDVRYKVLTTLARLTPAGLQARFQSVGRR